jgi:DNA-directed RNA polymerase
MKLEEREEFAMNSLENVFDSADHPLDVYFFDDITNNRGNDGG